jgi:hypothetical protein
MSMQKPGIRSGWLYWTEPPGEDGIEALHFANCNRRVSLHGEFLRELEQRVLPLLDGCHPLEQIQVAAEPDLAASEVLEWLDVLCNEEIVENAPLSEVSAAQPRFELLPEPSPPERGLLSRSLVVLLGSGLAAEAAAAHLRERGVGSLQIANTREAAGFEGAHLAISLLDASWTGTVLDFAAAAWSSGTPFLSCRVEGTEISLGSLIVPGKTPCFRCQEARELSACANPALEKHLLKLLERRNERDWFVRQSPAATVRASGLIAADEGLRFLLGREPRPRACASVPGCPACGAIAYLSN